MNSIIAEQIKMTEKYEEIIRDRRGIKAEELSDKIKNIFKEMPTDKMSEDEMVSWLSIRLSKQYLILKKR